MYVCVCAFLKFAICWLCDLEKNLTSLCLNCHTYKNRHNNVIQIKTMLKNVSFHYYHYYCYFYMVLLLERGPGPKLVYRPVVCGFLSWYRKDFTIGVQVIMRVNLLKLGIVKQGRV